VTNRLAFVSLVISAAVAISLLVFIASERAENRNQPPVRPAPQEPAAGPEDPQDSEPVFYGISRQSIDSTVRFRRRGNRFVTFGSGEVIAEAGDHYVAMSNHHVTDRKGTRNEIDLFSNGHLVKTVKMPVKQSWYKAGQSVDVSVTAIKKSSLGDLKLSVVPLAPRGWVKENIQPGDTITTIGCSDGRWPRARSGNVLDRRNGLLYIEPTSIGGDSGGPVYEATGQYVMGVTAWSLRMDNGKEVCLSMTSDRIHDIMEGIVSGTFALPEGAKEIDTSSDHTDLSLPFGALQVEQAKD